MSSQHVKENVGRKYIIQPEVSRKKLLSLRNKKVNKMTDEELEVWLKYCYTLEEWFKPSGRFRKQKRAWVKHRQEAESELGKRDDRE